jgi:DNA replication initiation complex subunit (GINS family)
MVDISFEEIHELLRSEKYSSDLQPLSEEQLMQICRYLESKKQLFLKQRESVLFENSPQDKLRDELDNANRALRDFYDKREKKMITRAIFTARSGSQLRDTTNMLKSEEMVYDQLVETLRKSWGNFFSYLNSKPQEKSQTVDEKPLNNVSGEISITEQVTANLTLRFTDAVPELLDSELKRWGPFAKDQVAEVPAELAGLLMKQAKAVEVNKNEITQDSK